MKFGCNDFCVYCKYIGKEKTNMDDIELYKCENCNSKNYNKTFDRFSIVNKKCKDYHSDPELTI